MQRMHGFNARDRSLFCKMSKKGKENNEDFRVFKAKIARKKIGKEDPMIGGSEMEYITVQRLSSNAEGRYQKYARIGALALNCKPTIANINLKLHLNASLKPMTWNVTF